jgi:hypothetical protein
MLFPAMILSLFTTAPGANPAPAGFDRNSAGVFIRVNPSRLEAAPICAPPVVPWYVVPSSSPQFQLSAFNFLLSPLTSRN